MATGKKSRPIIPRAIFQLLALFSCILASATASAVNFYEETRISDELASQLSTAEVLWLELKDQPKVLSVFQPSSKTNTKGGVIILHDYNDSIDWPDSRNPLRKYLPNYQ
ncbi:MAG: DUF3530 family protein, partial [Gammaproteobacteria bacterium]|nr:DUF3530 family protein [Gammaproteobacteria bacterium]